MALVCQPSDPEHGGGAGNAREGGRGRGVSSASTGQSGDASSPRVRLSGTLPEEWDLHWSLWGRGGNSERGSGTVRNSEGSVGGSFRGKEGTASGTGCGLHGGRRGRHGRNLSGSPSGQ